MSNTKSNTKVRHFYTNSLLPVFVLGAINADKGNKKKTNIYNLFNNFISTQTTKIKTAVENKQNKPEKNEIDEYDPNIMLIVHDREHKVKGLALKYSKTDEKKAKSICSNDEDKKFFDITLDEKNTCLFIASKTDADKEKTSEKFEEISKKILNQFLNGARPVARMRSSFFIPLRNKNAANKKKPLLGKDTLLKKVQLDEENWEFLPPEKGELGYFSTDFQKIMGSCEKTKKHGECNSIESYEYKNNNNWSITLEQKNKRTTNVKINNIRTHFAASDIVFVEIECAYTQFTSSRNTLDEKTIEQKIKANKENTKSSEEYAEKNASLLLKDRETESLWRYYLDIDENDNNVISLAQAMDFNNLARFTKLTFQGSSLNRQFNIADSIPTDEIPKFADKDDEQSFGKGYSALFSEIFRKQKESLIYAPKEGPILDLLNLQHLSDKRSFVMSSIIVDGDSLENSVENQSLFSRMGMMDGWGVGHNYDKKASLRDLRKFAYRRYWSWGTYYLISDHSFIFCSSRGAMHKKDSENGKDIVALSFSERLIHQEHMRTIYRRMMLFALILRYKLIALGHDIRACANQLENDRYALSKVRKEFLDFKARFWTLHPSTQLQGIELFDHIERQLRLNLRLREIDQRISEFESFQSIKAETKATMLRNILYYLGLPIALFLFILPSNDQENLQRLILDFITNDPSQSVSGDALIFMTVVAICIILALLIIIIAEKTLGLNDQQKKQIKRGMFCFALIIILFGTKVFGILTKISF